jgi:hypothetical protein
MRELVSTSVAIRLLPESSSAGVRCVFFLENFSVAWEKPTPVVISLQHRLIHKGHPRSSSSCSVNLFDVALFPFFRGVARG